MLTYFRCSDCLTAFTSQEKRIDWCACGGKVQAMGVVHGPRYRKTEECTACDERCTNAVGPSCNCQCGGENHGTGKTVQTVVEQGMVKVSALQDPAKSMRIANEFHSAFAEAKKRLYAKHGLTLKQIIHRIYIADKTEYWAAINAERALNSAKSYKVHKLRMEYLANFLKDVQVEAA